MRLSFWLSILIVAACTGAGYYILMSALPEKLQFNGYLYILIFFIASTAAFHYGLNKSAGGGGKRFIRYYMGATGAKLFMYVIIIMIYAVANKASAMAFALCFLIFYLVFTFFEVLVAYRQFGAVVKTQTESTTQ